MLIRSLAIIGISTSRALLPPAATMSSTGSCGIKTAPEGLSSGCVGAPLHPGQKLPIAGDESIMSSKTPGGSTTAKPVQGNLRYNISNSLASRICSFNRHYAEPSGSFESTSYFSEIDRTKETTYYDSVTGRPLFIAPRGRTFEAFAAESRSHGWPSFRDEEVVWNDVRVLPDGECVSTAGTHLGHNLPDRKGVSTDYMSPT